MALIPTILGEDGVRPDLTQRIQIQDLRVLRGAYSVEPQVDLWTERMALRRHWEEGRLESGAPLLLIS